MPAKRIIITDRTHDRFGYILRADVPSGNQPAFRNSQAVCSFRNATSAELQEVRDGLVAEKSGRLDFDAPIANVQSYLESRWTEWQAEVTAQTTWAEDGRSWNGTSWAAPAGIPMASVEDTAPLGLAAFDALTGTLAFTANRIQFALYNGVSATTSLGLAIRVRSLVHFSGRTAVTGVAPGVWTVRRRTGTTAIPAGTGGITPVSHDSTDVLFGGLTCWSNPQTAPAGGTLETLRQYLPQADEQKLTTADMPSMLALTPWGGQVIYAAANEPRAKPWTLRPGQCLEVVQDATAGTGGGQILCTFTVG